VRSGSGGSALRLALRILVIALAVYLILPQLAGLEASGRALARARRWWLPPLVFGLEAASLLAYAELVRTVLVSTGQPVARRLIQRVTFAGYALGRTLPGGSMSALAVITSELRGLGFSAAPTAAALAASGLVSSVMLVLLFPFAALLALLGGEGGGVVLGAAGLGALLVLAVALTARPTLRRPEALGRVAARAAATVARGPLRRYLDPAAVGAQVTRSAQGLRDLAHEPTVLRRAGAWAAANWLLDLAVLVTITATLGPGVPKWGLPLAYILGQWTASVPLTPGGVGLVESAMTAALVAGGVPGGVAAASVLGWRLVSHWIPIGVGLAMLPTLRRNRPPAEAGQEGKTRPDPASRS
jgi:uncharacterized membrane protein YbhN (UPF0104 family)